MTHSTVFLPLLSRLESLWFKNIKYEQFKRRVRLICVA